ncbi:hypothetical protein [Janthinobacterium sp.]|uniref:hypothetical protein n=1 Tax=Janthinobacterium sp. TaxID=1871054 RepID=UPI0025BBE857|nr:hypothetical protein [Janthinobacterium sp.]NBV16818.1 hypothetical protein [Janthinobacterium sp.]
MNILELLKQATPSPEPMATGEWATLAFRPDLGSQQEFIIGVAAAIKGERKPFVRWLPSLSKLCSLYGDAISGSETKELLRGSEIALTGSTHSSFSKVDSGTPHVRVVPCGYFATNDVEFELDELLKRQSGFLWDERGTRESPMDDDWAYSLMINALSEVQLPRDVFLPARSIFLGGKTLKVALDNSLSYGNIVSARYSQFQTVERHIFKSLRQVMSAHKFSGRHALPALFVVLPEQGTPLESLLSKRSSDLLFEIEDMGAIQFCDPNPIEVAKKIEAWAGI